MTTRRTFMTAALATPMLIVARPALAAEPAVFAQGGIAIRGADPVAYFTQGGAVSGDAAHTLMWNGATWYFASAANMETFVGDPLAFAPQYGGYCAFAMARGYIATSVPEAFTIHDGKLYLNYSLNVRETWLRDIEGNIAAADPRWPEILG